MELFEFEITCEPLPDPLLDALDPAERDRVDQITEAFRNCPRSQVAAVEDLVARYPHVPRFQNYLAMASQDAGEVEKGKRMIRLTYERFPDYLFGMINYAHLCMREGRIDEVPAVFGGALALHRLYPDRTCFHISEVVGFFSLVAEFHIRTGNMEAARPCSELLEQLAPRHPATRKIRSMQRRKRLVRFLERLVPPTRSQPALLEA